MYIKYNKIEDIFTLEYSENDRCPYCSLEDTCPLISALTEGEYCVSRYANIPTEEFCDAYNPNIKLSEIETSLKKKRKTRDK